MIRGKLTDVFDDAFEGPNDLMTSSDIKTGKGSMPVRDVFKTLVRKWGERAARDVFVRAFQELIDHNLLSGRYPVDIVWNHEQKCAPTLNQAIRTLTDAAFRLQDDNGRLREELAATHRENAAKDTEIARLRQEATRQHQPPGGVTDLAGDDEEDFVRVPRLE